MSKTPRFDAALDAIFAELVPHERTCRQCSQVFPIETDDIEFLKKLRVPPPTLCPRCRLQQRMAHRCTFKPSFHKRQCGAPGHNEQILTYVDDKASAIVYDDEFYRSDHWDPMNFGSTYDSSTSFFDQFSGLLQQVPRQSLGKDPASIKSDYVIMGKAANNCYYVVVPFSAENLQYGTGGFYSKDCIDFLMITSSENCYSCVLTSRTFGCNFCVNSSDCINSYFLYDCRNCSDCFGGTNLRNKQYVFFNEQLTKEEYARRMQEIDLGSHTTLEAYKAAFAPLLQAAIRKNLEHQKVQNVSGNNIYNSSNCHECYNILVGGGENLRYAGYVEKSTDCMDIFGAASNSLLYQATGHADCSRTVCSSIMRSCQDSEYSIECTNVKNVFGCVGLKNKQYCIFNTQYTEEEYWPRVDELKTAMLTRGEYGEFFPMTFSIIAYNDSSAMVEFPMSREDALTQGLLWHDRDQSGPQVDPSFLIQESELPDNIKDVDDSILSKAIVCSESGRPFRLTPYELNFYRQHNVPLPRLHPDVRIDKLFEHHVPYRLFDDHCKKCGKEIQSGYDPAKGYTVYCESCYQTEVA